MESNPLTFWENYVTEAMSYAVLPPDHEEARTEAVCGIIAEMGETAALFQRKARTDGPLDLEKLLKELGDWLWYIVRLHWLRVLEATPAGESLNQSEACTGVGLELSILADKFVGSVFINKPIWWLRVPVYPFRFDRAFSNIVDLANAHGFTMQQVATANLAKLEARRKAGTLQGSGDNR